MRQETLAEFDRQGLVNWVAWHYEGLIPSGTIDLATQDAAITGGGETLALWTLGTSVEDQALAQRLRRLGSERPDVLEQLGRGELARRQYREADALLARAEPYAPHPAQLRQLRILARGLAGDRDGAARLLGEAASATSGAAAAASDVESAWAWLNTRFSLAPGSD
jgi:hypothetical protein